MRVAGLLFAYLNHRLTTDVSLFPLFRVSVPQKLSMAVVTVTTYWSPTPTENPFISNIVFL